MKTHFLFFNLGEIKSEEMTCRCTCLISLRRVSFEPAESGRRKQGGRTASIRARETRLERPRPTLLPSASHPESSPAEHIKELYQLLRSVHRKKGRRKLLETHLHFLPCPLQRPQHLHPIRALQQLPQTPEVRRRDGFGSGRWRERERVASCFRRKGSEGLRRRGGEEEDVRMTRK
jgi:hypothetical protein